MRDGAFKKLNKTAQNTLNKEPKRLKIKKKIVGSAGI